METRVIAQVRRTQLTKLYKQLQAGAFPKSRLKTTRCELTVIDGQITIAVPWAQYSLEAETAGTAKATFPLGDISKVLRTFMEIKITIKVSEDHVWLNNFSIKASTCFFDDDKILRSVVLPVNNTELDLVRLLNGRYTQQELEFNKLWAKAVSAETRLNTALNSAYLRLKVYGVTYDELETMVRGKIDL